MAELFIDGKRIPISDFTLTLKPGSISGVAAWRRRVTGEPEIATTAQGEEKVVGGDLVRRK